MSVLDALISELKDVCAGLPDQRWGPRRDGEYVMADIGLSASSVFFMGSPSFLAHQRALEEGQVRSLTALDGAEHFCSRKIHRKRRSVRLRSDGGTEYFYAFLGASIVAPGHTRTLPLPPEFVAPQDGAEKQDCERNAAKRWLARDGPTVAHLRPVYLVDDLFACQPIAEAIHLVGGIFILTCKASSHRTVSELLYSATLEEHRRTEIVRGKRTTTS